MSLNGKGACPKMHAIISGKATVHTWDKCHHSLSGKKEEHKKVETEASTVEDDCFEYQKLLKNITAQSVNITKGP